MIDKQTVIIDKQFEQKKYLEKKIETDKVLLNIKYFGMLAPRIMYSWDSLLVYSLSPTFIISNFFFGPFSTPGNCPNKFVRYFEPCYLDLFHFTHSNVGRIHSKNLIECFAFLIST